MRQGLEELDSKLEKITEKMDELARLERQARDLANALKDRMVKDVQEVRLPGIVVHENGAGTFAVVKSSTLCAHNHNWAPSTYIPREQAEAVVRELENATTVEAICRKVASILVKGWVEVGRNDRTYLNESTMDAIRNSDLGIYVAAKCIGKGKS